MENTKEYNNYYNKYKKYKEKYINLQNKIKKQTGGEILKTCTNYDISMYNIPTLSKYLYKYYPKGGFEMGERLPNGLEPANFEINTSAEGTESGDFKNLEFDYIYEPINVNGSEKLPKINKKFILNLENLKSPVLKVYTHDNNNFTRQRGLGIKENYYPTPNMDLITSIIGKNLGLVCDNNVDNFIEVISGITNLPEVPIPKIIFIDFANIAYKLYDTLTELVHEEKINIVAKYINLYLYKNCKIYNNYVFIIFKGSVMFDLNFLTLVLNGPVEDPKLSLLDLLNLKPISFLNIICCGFASQNQKDLDIPSGYGLDPGKWDENIQLFTGLLKSSIDDFIFWICVVFTYNLIYLKNPNYNLDNFIILTNDTQSFNKTDCNYWNDVTNLNILEYCGREGILPQKNLLNLIFPNKCLNNQISSEYELFLYTIKYTPTTLRLESNDDSGVINTISKKSYFKTYDKLLNNYINFIYNLFAKTPLKLDPNLLIKYTDKEKNNKSVLIKEYRNVRDYKKDVNRVLNKRYNNNKPETWGDLDSFVSLFEKLLLENIVISDIRTDVINFLFNTYPWDFTNILNSSPSGGPNGKIPLYIILSKTNVRGSVEKILNNNFDLIHPGLFFYYQVKNIQHEKFNSERVYDAMDIEEIKNLFIFKNSYSVDFVNFIIDYINELKTIQLSLIDRRIS